MKTQTQYMLAILLLLVSYGHTKASELDYSTEQIRNMWQTCSNNFRTNLPQIPDRIRHPLCDCYMDEVKTKYSAQRVKVLTWVEAQKLGLEISRICKISEDLLNKPKVTLKGTT